VTWTEPFIVLLLAFQVFMFGLCLTVSRKNTSLVPRVAVMVFVGATVRGAEFLNRYGAAHWRQFATQNYFDERGVFVSLFLCAPLLLDCFLMLVLFLREAVQLLVQVKKSELKKKQQQQQGGGGSSGKRRAKKDQ